MAGLILLVALLLALAWMTRYVPVSSLETWDRWRHRSCIVGPGKVTCFDLRGHETIEPR